LGEWLSFIFIYFGSKALFNSKDTAIQDSDSVGATDRPEWKILEKVALASMGEQRKTRRWGGFFK